MRCPPAPANISRYDGFCRVLPTLWKKLNLHLSGIWSLILSAGLFLKLQYILGPALWSNLAPTCMYICTIILTLPYLFVRSNFSAYNYCISDKNSSLRKEFCLYADCFFCIYSVKLEMYCSVEIYLYCYVLIPPQSTLLLASHFNVPFNPILTKSTVFIKLVSTYRQFIRIIQLFLFRNKDYNPIYDVKNTFL